jgi:hypothetical protein
VADPDGAADGVTLADTMLAEDDADGDAEATLLDGDALGDLEGVLDADTLDDVEGVTEVVGLELTLVPDGDALTNKEGVPKTDGLVVGKAEAMGLADAEGVT